MKQVVPFILCASLASLTSACMGSADSADGDGGANVGFGGAQDIGQFRGILDDGGIPGENTLDANGFFNEHFTELPDPDCGQIICAHGMLAVGKDWQSGNYQAALQVAMNTTVDPADLERLPLNLTIVVDTSGSMATEDRIEFVKQGLHLLVDQLEEGDRLALVRYSSDVEVVASFTPEALDRVALHQTVDQLVAQGATNIYGGLEAGFELAKGSFDPERQNRVILLSDGLATSGITDDRSILEMSVENISEGIGLTTIGVGSDFNVELMRGLAERGAGNFYFLEDADAVAEVFVDEIDYFVTPLALSVRVQVTAGEAYELGEVVGTRLWKAEGDSGEVFIPGVFVASRTSSTPDPNGRRGGGSALVIAMIPRQGAFDDLGQVARIRLSYRLPGSDELMSQVVTVNNPADPGVPPDEDIYVSHQAMAKHYAMYNIFLGLREATRTADYDYSCAMAQLNELDQRITEWNTEFEDPDIAADQILVQKFMGNLEAQGVSLPDPEYATYCAGFEDGPYYDDIYYDDEYYGCSVSNSGQSGSGLGFLGFGLALLIGVRRRRK